MIQHRGTVPPRLREARPARSSGLPRRLALRRSDLAPQLSRGLAEQFGFKIYPPVAEALGNGTGKLAVDAVLLIGEHGRYPEVRDRVPADSGYWRGSVANPL